MNKLVICSTAANRLLALGPSSIRKSTMSASAGTYGSNIMIPSSTGVEYTPEYLHEEGLEISKHHHVEGEIIRVKKNVEFGENHHVDGVMIRTKEHHTQFKNNLRSDVIDNQAARGAVKNVDVNITGTKHSYLLSLFETVSAIPQKSRAMELIASENDLTLYIGDLKSAHSQGGQYLRQINSEEKQHQVALDDYLSNVKKLVNYSKASDLKFVQKIISSWYDPLLNAIKNEVQNIKERKSGELLSNNKNILYF